jgi:hypothetical protein
VQRARRAFPQVEKGRVAQRESACFTRKRSQVQNLPRPQKNPRAEAWSSLVPSAKRPESETKLKQDHGCDLRICRSVSRA